MCTFECVNFLSLQTERAPARQVLPDRSGGERAWGGHVQCEQADEDGGRRDQQEPAGTESTSLSSGYISCVMRTMHF